jgi:hypothetical protein
MLRSAAVMTTPSTIHFTRPSATASEHDTQWPSEKKKPTPTGLRPSQQLARGVVDGRDVVCVEGVAKAEGESEAAQAGSSGGRPHRKAGGPNPTGGGPPPEEAVSRLRSPLSKDWRRREPTPCVGLTVIATKSQVGIQIPSGDATSSQYGLPGRAAVRCLRMDLERLPPRLHPSCERSPGDRQPRACNPIRRASLRKPIPLHQ